MVGEPVLKVATYNVQHARLRSGEVDPDALADACASLDADVLGLQEVDVHVDRSHGRDLAAVVAEATGMQWVFAPAIEFGGGGYGNALLSRGSIDDVEVVALTSPRRDEPRCAIVARTLDLSVATGHLGLRGEGLEQLPLVLDALARRSTPRVLFGDLNLEPDDVRPFAAAAGLRLLDIGPTFPAHAPRRCIDHVAVDGMDVETIEVVELPVSVTRTRSQPVKPAPSERSKRAWSKSPVPRRAGSSSPSP